VPYPPAARSVPITAFIRELDTLVGETMAEWKISGLAIAVVQNGDVALLQGYGRRNVEAGLPVTSDTQFAICSITKSFASTGLALLVDERRLDWTKPVRDYVPEFRLHDAVATDRISGRDLLCHHSGLPRHDWIWIPADLSPAQMLAAMRATSSRAKTSATLSNTRTLVLWSPARWQSGSAVSPGTNLPAAG
jgi:CubicO group peptidase (beta-lactamase class C family)